MTWRRNERPEVGVTGDLKTATTEVQIVNEAGLHARPVMRFVDLANTFEASLTVGKQQTQVDGKSPMEMMLLEAPQGSTLHITATGDDAGAMVSALVELVANRFDEP